MTPATRIDNVLERTPDPSTHGPSEGRFEVVDTVSDLRLAFAAAREAADDVVVIAPDRQLGHSVMRLRQTDPEPTRDRPEVRNAAVVLVTPTQDPSYLLGALTAGADAIVLASSPPHVLRRAIAAAREGGLFIDPAVSDVTGEVLAGLVRGWAQFDLSPRELQVLWWLPTGRSCADIADWIGVTEGTVKSYLHRIQTKLGADDRMELLAVARREGLL